MTGQADPAAVAVWDMQSLFVAEAFQDTIIEAERDEDPVDSSFRACSSQHR